MALVDGFESGVYDNWQECIHLKDGCNHVHCYHPHFGTKDYFVTDTAFLTKLRWIIRLEWINGYTITIQHAD
jgi:hypothetical protein